MTFPSITNPKETYVFHQVPAGLAEGVYDLVISGPLGTLTFQSAVKIGAVKITAPETRSVKKAFPGFTGNSAALTSGIRAKIAEFLKKNPGATSVTITGVMGPQVTKANRGLHTARAKAVAHWIQRLNPDITVTFATPIVEKTLTKQVRRVDITLNVTK